MALRRVATVVASSTLLATVCGLSIGVLSDLHVGEGCPSPYDNSTDCYSVQNLILAVNRINNVLIAQDGLDLVFITGDVTSSAETAQYLMAKSLLDQLAIPYYPILGNHDVWPYASSYEAPSPTGDQTFASVFQHILTSPAVSGYDNRPTWNPQNNCTSWFQNYELDLTAQHGLLFLACDWNTRDHALPGYKGALPQADLHNFTGGTYPWLQQRLAVPRANPNATIFLLHHQPYRCPFPIPDWAFCFSDDDKTAVQSALAAAHPISQYWGALTGHIHLWFNGTAFDQWPTFRQWETSACKGSAANPNQTSAITSMFFDQQQVSHINYYWQEAGVWYNVTGT